MLALLCGDAISPYMMRGRPIGINTYTAPFCLIIFTQFSESPCIMKAVCLAIIAMLYPHESGNQAS
jgi:hypothetical protein